MHPGIFSNIYLKTHRILRIRDRITYTARQCYGKNVLHVGCSDWPKTYTAVKNDNFLHRLITKSASKCIGIDISEEGLASLKDEGFDNCLRVDAENLTTVFKDKQFEMIVAAEVIEHIPNPGSFLSSAHKVLKDSGYLLISVPNAFWGVRILKLLLSRVEMVHKDHCFYFSLKSLVRLLEIYDFEITEIGYTFKMPDSILRSLFKLPLYLLYRFNPFFGQELIVLVQKSSQLKKSKNRYKLILK